MAYGIQTGCRKLRAIACAMEVFPSPGKLWGSAGLLKFLCTHDVAHPSCLDELHILVKEMTGSDILADDFSAVLARFP